jgi:hypothetical protein
MAACPVAEKPIGTIILGVMLAKTTAQSYEKAQVESSRYALHQLGGLLAIFE